MVLLLFVLLASLGFHHEYVQHFVVVMVGGLLFPVQPSQPVHIYLLYTFVHHLVVELLFVFTSDVVKRYVFDKFHYLLVGLLSAVAYLRLQHLLVHGLVTVHANVSWGPCLLMLRKHYRLVFYLVLVILAFRENSMYLLPMQA